MRKIATHCGPRLISVEAAGCKAMVTLDGLESLADLASNINYLDITLTNVGDDTMEIIAANVCCKILTLPFCMLFLF
jgi:hypothetical protein